ncbi:hypothetical protein HPB51_003879 [Rhipicephalus microplus]|uniref:C2H2-type domain-containing protein n=1 Tax=Rhipicephalus microplus TaxID=6941 RepID=A0A9J6EL26_RHIMP|nr:hypothetical protein HPB51_003879 [Rhipicephalus microplus]
MPYDVSSTRKCRRYSVSAQKAPKRKYTITRNHKCEVCGKALTSHARLQRHLATHACKKPYACPYCPATFARKFNLDEHLLTHTGEKRHGCPACGKMFARRWGVAVHFRVRAKSRTNAAIARLSSRIVST